MGSPARHGMVRQGLPRRARLEPKCLRLADPVRSYFQLGQNTCGSYHGTMGLSCGLKARIRVD
jgi:hypothetical protein